jgi:acyl-coenzyme A synthetase/AMP-(fatty) acid ligase
MARDRSMSPAPELSRAIARVLELDRDARAIEFEQRWYRWGDLGATASAVGEHAGEGTRVGVLLRNHPAHVGLLVGLLQAGACVVTINPARGRERVRVEISTLDLPVVAGEPGDLEEFVEPSTRAARLSCADLGAGVQLLRRPGRAAESMATTDVPEGTGRRRAVAVEMLTSGTTGPPKRIPLTYETLHRVLVGAKYYETNTRSEPRLRQGVAIVNSPLVHLGGLFRVLQCVTDGRSFCLLERFQVDEWVEAVRRHRPSTASLVPAALRMVLEADLDPADLSSLRSVVSGTAPLSPEDAEAFTAKYGVPVLISYAATEFGGGVAGWNVADHRTYWAAKRGSVGRAHPGCELRVVDPVEGAPLPPDREGLLEVKAGQLGDGSGWQRTTDLARIDEDGFVWILGRADQAIIRGGFKVRPDDVRAALERDPRVRAAAVVGRTDARLGAVPVAAVELQQGSPHARVEELLSAASSILAPYEMPVEIRVVDELPRTPSGKVDLAAVRVLLTPEEAEMETS